ncbi:G protein pathway suppressor 1 [Laetiporus sulphureus 93-53]|uniref:G protein pathway suppressor 1 n=1 Tax=Laetiporus sulphureus 93-53 TaxID=1314785 RepID=A0A165BC54_9APHY|nr:G protein pathway suppressor 1 [Laetiporus sulphureus 93-53]KZT00714.1 G protein pathway suppressor 1 [Laetiporus sulphureus 93-53]
MDVDSVEEGEVHGETVRRNGRHPTRLPVDDAHPFDLEAYCASYSGRSLVDRMIIVIQLCPTLAVQALQCALQTVFKMRDVKLYRDLVGAYESTASASNGQLSPPAEVSALDMKWIEETMQNNLAEKNKLEVELKTYTSNMIKESIRMAHRDLGDFFRATGDAASALKHYTKSREFCTTNQHVLDTFMSCLELLIEQRNYPHISTYVFKADAALDATTAARASANSAPTAPASASNKEKANAERESVQSKLDVGLAISLLGQGNYEKAAASFLKVGSVKTLGEWANTLIAPGDIAIYTTLCALASFKRPDIRSQVLDNDNFSVYIEQEPYVRELLESYMGNRFKAVLEGLEKYSTRHYVDIHLSSHMAKLIDLIRSRALVLYFQPFASIKLERMSSAFGWSIEELERQVVSLIQAGEIQARVDRQNKILKAKETDQRAALFMRTMKTGENMQSANRKLLLRMRLQQADLIVKAPKGHQPQTGHPSEQLPSDIF